MEYEFWMLYCKLRCYIKKSLNKTSKQKELIKEKVKWLRKYILINENEDFCPMEFSQNFFEVMWSWLNLEKI